MKLIILLFYSSFLARLPTILGNDMTSSFCSVDEDPCPPDSIGQAQSVPSSPTLVNESFKLQGGNILESWQLPTLNNSGSSRAASDLFNTYHQVNDYFIKLNNTLNYFKYICMNSVTQ